VLIRYFNNNIHWIPSIHVFTNNDGYVQIYLADAQQKNYRLRVFDEGHKPLFNIQHINESQLLLDKRISCMRAGFILNSTRATGCGNGTNSMFQKIFKFPVFHLSIGGCLAR
jgi:hypothetical protein